MNAQRTGETDDQRRRRREQAFGEVIPEQTDDDQEQPDPRAAADREAWLRAQVPPHHG